MADLQKPEFKPITEIKTREEFKNTGCIGCSFLLLIGGLAFFILNALTKDSKVFWDSFVYSVTFLLIVPSILLIISYYSERLKFKEYDAYVDKTKKENNVIQIENEVIKANFDNSLMLLNDKMARLNSEISNCNSTHPYMIAKGEAIQLFPNYENVILEIESFLPKEEDQEDTKFEDDPLLKDVQKLLSKLGKGQSVNVSHIQRRYGIGYFRATNILESMCKKGIIKRTDKNYEIIKVD